MQQQSKFSKIFIAIGAIIATLAVLLQLYVIIENRVMSIAQTLIKFFSYFTIISNIMVAICFTTLSVKPISKWGHFFSKAQTVTAINVYILVVGLVYNMVLRWLWSPKGLQLMADNLLHVVVPIWFLIYWIAWIPKVNLQWKNVFYFLIYPAVYCVYILVRGAISNQYPYFFIDAAKLGYPQVALNCTVLLVVFLVLSLLHIGLAKLMHKKVSITSTAVL